MPGDPKGGTGKNCSPRSDATYGVCSGSAKFSSDVGFLNVKQVKVN